MLKLHRPKWNILQAKQLIAVFLICLFASTFLLTDNANAETRTLKLYYLHTGEKTKVTYYKNGRYLASGLKKANWALRDWRRNEPIKMDPKLLDLVYEAYRKSGSKAWIHVISGYRSPKTNNALRRTRGGQAKNSQHTYGKALDFYLPDVKISKLREIGLKMGIGGVGYYPKSGSPFVHLDTGNVRHWPRMSRKQLVRMFPKGDTMHVPTDGKPLARYKTAVAAYKRRKASGKIVTTPEKKELNFFQRIAARTKDDEDEGSQNSVAVPRAVKTVRAPARPKPAPKPVVVEPVIAALPKNIPVPITAPRGNILNQGQEIVVAALPPENVVEVPPVQPAEIVTPEITTAEPVPEVTPSENFIIPTPTKRPQYETNIVTATLEPELQPEQPAEVAPVVELVKPVEVIANQPSVAGLSPTEIQDLRKQVTDNQTAILRPSSQPTLPDNSQNIIPRPAANVELAPNGLPLAKTFPVGSRPPSVPVQPIEPSQEIVVAKLEPVEQKPLETPVVVPEPKPAPEVTIIPTAKPERIETTTTELALAVTEENTPTAGEREALSAIEQATQSSDTVNNEPEIIQTLEQNAEEENVQNRALAFNIPIPTPSPRALTQAPEIVVAKLETPAQEEPQDEVLAPLPEIALVPEEDFEIEFDEDESQVTDPSLGSRTVSLDEFSAPENNSNSIGQYALASDITIRDLAAVQPPAYGRNMIRNVPSTVFVEGFRTDILPGTQLGFQGKAIVFSKFARIIN